MSKLSTILILVLAAVFATTILAGTPPNGHQGVLWPSGGGYSAPYDVSSDGSTLSIDGGQLGTWTSSSSADNIWFNGGSSETDASSIMVWWCYMYRENVGCMIWMFHVYQSTSPTGHGPPFSQVSSGLAD